MADEKKPDAKAQKLAQQSPAVDNTKRAEVEKAIEEHAHKDKNNPQPDYVERIDEKTSKH